MLPEDPAAPPAPASGALPLGNGLAVPDNKTLAPEIPAPVQDPVPAPQDPVPAPQDKEPAPAQPDPADFDVFKKSKDGNRPLPPPYVDGRVDASEGKTTHKNKTYNFNHGLTQPGQPVPVLEKLEATEVHRAYIPAAQRYLEQAKKGCLAIVSRYVNLLDLAALAMSRCLLDEQKDASCRSAAFEDEHGPVLSQALRDTKTDLLVLRLSSPRLLAKGNLHFRGVQSSGVRTVLLVELPDPSEFARMHLKGWQVWPLFSVADLLDACGAGENDARALANSRKDTGDADLPSCWPADDSDAEDLLAYYIAQGGLPLVTSNLNTPQVAGSTRAREIVAEAEKPGPESAIDLAVLFVASHFPGISLEEFTAMMEHLLDGILLPPAEAGGLPDRFRKPRPAFGHWRSQRREILSRNGLEAGSGETGATQVRFKNSSQTAAVEAALDPWDVQDWLEILHRRHWLLRPRLSAAAANGLIRATVRLFHSAPETYHAGWLVAQVKAVLAQLADIQSRGHNGADTLFSRLADLAWSLSLKRPAVLGSFLNLLSAESRSQGFLALELVIRLRRQGSDGQEDGFDASSWLAHLLATGSSDTCLSILGILAADANKGSAATWSVLGQVAQWLPAAGKWNQGSGTDRWAPCFLYQCYLADIDRFFFEEDAETIPKWPARLKLLADWLTSYGFMRSMDWLQRQASIHLDWVQELNLAPQTSGEMFLAEMLDYWHSEAQPETPRRKRVIELLQKVRAQLQDNCGADRSKRPDRRDLYRALEDISRAWGDRAGRIFFPAERLKWEKRRDDASRLAKFFRPETAP